MNDNKYSYLFDTEQLIIDIKERSIRGGMVTSFSQVLLFFLRLASIMILARILLPEDFGLIGMVTALTVFIERFSDFGLGDAIVQKKEIKHEQVSTLFWLNLLICIALTILIASFSKIVSWFYNDQRLNLVTVAFAINFIFSGLCIQHNAIIRRRMRFDHFALIKIFSTAISIIAAIAFALCGYGYWALVWKELTRSSVAALLAWIFCPWRPGLPSRGSGVRSMLKFGGNVTGYNLFHYLSNNLDSILLGKFCGPVQLGYYSRAKQLTTIPVGQLYEPMQYVSLAALSALQNEPSRYKNYYGKMIGLLTFIYMPIIVYIGIYAYPIVYIALGSRWMAAVPIFRLLAISVFASPFVEMLGLTMLSTGQTRRYLIWGFFKFSSIVISFLIGIQWGVIGIAASLSISTTVNLIFSLTFVFKNSHIKFRSTLNNVYRSAIASIAMGIFLLFTYSILSKFQLTFQMPLSFILGVAIYLGFWLLFPNGYHKIMEYFSYPLSAFKQKKQLS